MQQLWYVTTCYNFCQTLSTFVSASWMRSGIRICTWAPSDGHTRHSLRLADEAEREIAGKSIKFSYNLNIFELFWIKNLYSNMNILMNSLEFCFATYCRNCGHPAEVAWCPDTLRRTRTHRVWYQTVKANERAIKGCQTGCGNSLLDNCGQEELAAWRAQERAKYRLPYFAFLLLRCSF